MFGFYAENLLSIEPGRIILRNTEKSNLFEHEHVITWHNFLLEIFHSKFTQRRYALILPCSSVKPYRLSPTHQIVEKRLSNSYAHNKIQVYVLSEPMILVPRELDIYYPFANYDYPPKELDQKHRNMFIEILSNVLKKLEYHKHIVAFLPKHHMNILQNALYGCGQCVDVTIYEYGKKAFQQIKKVVDYLIDLVANDTSS